MNLDDKCALCGKKRGQHQARTQRCPAGRYNRKLHGYPYYDAAQTFQPKEALRGQNQGAARGAAK